VDSVFGDVVGVDPLKVIAAAKFADAQFRGPERHSWTLVPRLIIPSNHGFLGTKASARSGCEQKDVQSAASAWVCKLLHEQLQVLARLRVIGLPTQNTSTTNVVALRAATSRRSKCSRPDQPVFLQRIETADVKRCRLPTAPSS